jgi:hypothetical protein
MIPNQQRRKSKDQGTGQGPPVGFRFFWGLIRKPLKANHHLPRRQPDPKGLPGVTTSETERRTRRHGHLVYPRDWNFRSSVTLSTSASVTSGFASLYK